MRGFQIWVGFHHFQAPENGKWIFRLWCNILKKPTKGLPDSSDVISYLECHWSDLSGYCIISWNLNLAKPASGLKIQIGKHLVQLLAKNSESRDFPNFPRILILTVAWHRSGLNVFLFEFWDQIRNPLIKTPQMVLFLNVRWKNIFGFILGVNWDIFHPGLHGFLVLDGFFGFS